MTALAPSALEARLAPDVTAAAAGDRDAFARLIAASANVVCAIALAITRDVAASEDVAQDVFLAAWTGLPRMKDPASFLPWVRQIARYRARDWQRTRARRRTELAGDDVLAAVADPEPGAPIQLLAAEERRALADALAALPEEARELVTLYYREGASTAELAVLLGISEAGVRQRLARVRAALQADLADRLGTILRKSAPGAAFAAAVVAGVVAAPGTATAAAIAGTTAKGAAKVAAGKVAATVAGGAALGIFAGLLGVVLGLRPLLRDAADPDERRALLAFGRRAGATTIAAGLGYTLTGLLHSPALGVATQLLFGGAMMYLYWYRLPRLTARHDAMRVAASPRYARTLRFRRRYGRLAFLLGFGVSTATLIASLVNAGW